MKQWLSVVLAALLAACSTPSVRPDPAPAFRPPVAGPSTHGKYYLDDGPPDFMPAELERIPDAVPRKEALNPWTLRPYVALGQTFSPMTSVRPFEETGIASWYGRRYHGKKTASGETYDMLTMSAAHPTLPLPSYARVTNLSNGRSVVVRVNDRGPFLRGRVIDLSFAAAYRLGYAELGQARVRVESIMME